jgi:hypothetical protein
VKKIEKAKKFSVWRFARRRRSLLALVFAYS